MKREDLVALVRVAEKIVSETNIQRPEYSKVKDAVTFCRNWLDGDSVEEERIYEFLDDEDEDDLVGYYTGADNEADKEKFGIILGVVSCVAASVLEENKSPIPQFLGGVDAAYYEAVVRDARNYEKMYCCCPHELEAELEKGYIDMLEGRTKPAKQAFSDLRSSCEQSTLP